MGAISKMMQYFKFSIGLLVLLLVGAFGAPRAQAEQRQFRLKSYGNEVAYNYQWADLQQQVHKLGFNLPQYLVQKGASEFQPFEEAKATAYIQQRITAQGGSLAPGVQIIFDDGNATTGFGYKVRATSQDGVANMTVAGQKVQALLAEYLSTIFMHFQDADGKFIVPDYKRIVERYTVPMRPVALAMRRDLMGLDSRAQFNYILSFFQSIPYDRLESRATSNGSGFATPFEVLTRNRGDCDSKTVAMISLLRNFFPQLRMIMILIPEHAFLGVELPQGPGDFALGVEGRRYVLADPTGPGLYPLGQVTDRSQELLREHEYQYVKFP